MYAKDTSFVLQYALSSLPIAAYAPIEEPRTSGEAAREDVMSIMWK
jgi:hypothetical protein